MRVGAVIGIAMAAGTAGVVGCGQPSPEPVRACTMIGCESGLSVRFAEGFGEPVSVEVSGPGATPQSVTCSADRPCGDGVFFRDFLAEAVTIRIRTEAGTMTRTGSPVYRTVQPNGEGCPPTCRQGEVLIAGGSDGAEVEDPPLSPARRPGRIVDTLLIEGMAERMPMRLVAPAEGFPLLFTTYLPEDWESGTESTARGAAFHMIPGPQWMEGGLVEMVVHPRGTSRSGAFAIVRSVAEAGNADVEPLTDPDPWALVAHRFRRPGGDPGSRITGWIELGHRDGRYFHLMVRHPAVMGDGMGPRVAAIMRHWRWEPSGDRLGG